MTPMTPGRLIIKVEDDGMVATAERLDMQPMDRLELLDLLAGAGVVAGIDDVACERVIAMDLDAGDVLVIARGTPPVAGVNGSFVPLIEPGILPGKVREDGSIDFHDRDLLHSVPLGGPLGTLRAPTPGVPGQRVDGRPVPAVNGKPAPISFGQGVVVDPDGAVRAARAGVILHRPGVSLDVTDHHVHVGDVDLKSGDLRLEGGVSVRGFVTRTFSVKATGDVDVQSGVDGGSVHAGGNVHIGGMVRGVGAGLVWADGDVVLRSAESAEVYSGGTLRVAEALNSQLHARKVEVTRRIRGGAILAEESIIAQEAGSPDGAPTYLTVGEPRPGSLQDVLSASEAAKKLRDAARQAPGTMRGDRAKGGKAARVQAAISALEVHDRAVTAERRDELARGAFVHVPGALHAGVVVQIGPARYNVDEDLRGARFTLDAESKTIQLEKVKR